MTTINPIESPVQIVGKSSTPAAAGGGNIAQKRADSLHGESVTKPARNGDMSTQQPPKNGRFYLPNGYPRTCDHCGREYIAKRDTSRFCGNRCRMKHHRATREAGGGRAGVFLALAAVAVVIWYIWPFLMDVAAARPRLPHQVDPTAVPVISATAQPAQPDQAPTAVPVIIIIPDPATPEPLPTAVPAMAEPLPTMAPATVIETAYDPAIRNTARVLKACLDETVKRMMAGQAPPNCEPIAAQLRTLETRRAELMEAGQ